MAEAIPASMISTGQERYRLVFENAASLIVALDLDGVIRDCNWRAIAVLGIDPQQAIGRPMTDFLHPDDHARAWDSLRRIATENVRYEEYRLFHADGSVVHATVNSAAIFDERGAVSEVISILDDITAKKQIEQALKTEKEFVVRLIESAPVMISLVDADRRIVRTNPALNQASGFGPEEVAGHDLLEFVREDEREQAADVFRRVMAGESVSHITSRLLTKDGRHCEVGWCFNSLRDADANISGVLMIGHDITELRQAQAQAMQSERLAAIGQMVAGLAHESGNALGRSQACLEMLAFRVEHDPTAADLVRRLQAAQDDLQRLYEQLRQYAAPMLLRRERVELREAIREVWEQLELVCRDRVTRFSLHGSCDGPCRADRLAVQRVFRNILQNALDAAPDPVVIEVHCQATSWRDEPAVRIAIRDNGPGLTAEQETRLFEPFYTTKTHGTGLGMAISRRIVEAHGGWIAVGRDAASGAEIVVVLPKG